MMKEMMLDQNKASIKKLIAIVLVLVSLVCLLSSGFGVRAEIGGRKYTVDDVLRYAGVSSKELKRELRSELNDMSEDFDDIGMRPNINKVVKLAGNILDGKITILDLARTGSYGKKMMGQSLRALEPGDEWSRAEYSTIEQAKTGMAFACGVMWFIILAAVASAAYAVYAILKGKKRACLIYTIIVVLMVIAWGAVVEALNSIMAMAEYEVVDMLEDLGMINHAYEVNLRIFHVRIVTFLSLLSVVGACVLAAGSAKQAAETMAIEKSESAFVPEPAAVPRPVVIAEKKNCPNCGKTVQEDQIFCDNCGTDLRKKPELPKENRCPVCGATVGKNAAFCGCCGSAVRK